MSTKKLDYRVCLKLQPSHALWKRYQPKRSRYAFRCATPAQAKRWQKATRTALSRLVGFQDIAEIAAAPRLIERVDRGDYVREKVVIRTTAHTVMPVFLLLPKHTPKPWPVVLAFHGHGYGVKDIVGLWEDGKERNAPDGYQRDFGVALCRKGFAVAAPEISCFGERLTDFSKLNTLLAPSTCTHTAMLAFHLGLSVVGLRVLDGRRLVDYLASRRDLDVARLGAMGISGGGMHTFFSTCLDQRIKACVVSGYYCTFRDSILAMTHCACNVVPGLHQFGEMEDLVGLIAPRPMLIEAGSYDSIFPIAAVRKSAARARAIYRLWGRPAAFETDFFAGRHQISGRRAYDFLQRNLQGAQR